MLKIAYWRLWLDSACIGVGICVCICVGFGICLSFDIDVALCVCVCIGVQVLVFRYWCKFASVVVGAGTWTGTLSLYSSLSTFYRGT